ncbi:hypothetical protein JZX76_00875 [Haloarcula hispanica]|jgi:hypothetical protein|uniref:Uncharacterized protein n=1 Tax=Haloarcula hispanica TaxID=51589 RepID=A0A482TS15_HALHI|nr:hypothetical protein [Haloarcula hispanica]MCJ0618131.1 hypothetical protein [Haloarcula hispanica]RYJ15645.1 hypothetical protein ELS20_00905 [Haloarcula hispanica]
MMEGVAQAGFYTWDPNGVEHVLNEVLSVADHAELPYSWDGDEPATATDIGLGDVLLLHADETEFRIRFEPDDEIERRLKRFLGLSTSARYLVGTDEHGDQYEGYTATFVDLIRRLSIALEPDYVSVGHPVKDVRPSPLEIMPTEGVFEIERLPWLSVYSPSLIDQFGWTDRISASPAWKVDQLDTGAVLLIKTQEPWADVSRDHPLDKHLLDGDDA